MSNTLTVIFTKRIWNPGSWLIRWGLPRTRFHFSRASHCLVVDGEYLIEASAIHGVRRVLASEALKGAVIVRTTEYEVAGDAEKALEWLRSQVGKRYDWNGAAGLSIAPDRDWLEPDEWFCFELVAALLHEAGRRIFSDDAGHITGEMLMAVNPKLT